MTKSAAAKRRARAAKAKANQQKNVNQMPQKLPSSKQQRTRRMGGSFQTRSSTGAPSVVSRNVTGSGIQFFNGTDYIDTVPVDANTVDGSIIYEVDINPLEFPETHLGSIARSYEKFRFTKLEFEVITKMPATTAGGYMAAFTADSNVILAEGPNAKRFVRANNRSVSANWYLSTRIVADLAQSDPWYFTSRNSDEESKTVQCKFILLCDGAPVNVQGNLNVTINMTYTCKFVGPIAGQPNVGKSLGTTEITLQKGTVNYIAIPATHSLNALDVVFGEDYYNWVYYIDPPCKGDTAIYHLLRFSYKGNEKRMGVFDAASTAKSSSFWTTYNGEDFGSTLKIPEGRVVQLMKISSPAYRSRRVRDPVPDQPSSLRVVSSEVEVIKTKMDELMQLLHNVAVFDGYDVASWKVVLPAPIKEKERGGHLLSESDLSLVEEQ